MILRTTRTPFLRTPCLAACAIAVVIAMAFVAEEFGWLCASVVIVCALTLPLGTLALLGVLRGRELMDRAAGRICFTCPKCGRSGRPLFRCPGCKGTHDDLQSGLYGVLSARCGHVGCEVPLPTCAASGRNTLAKVCSRPGCGEGIPHHAAGAIPEFRIAIVGAASSGKSNLLATAVWFLRDQFAPANGFEVSFASPVEEKAFNKSVDRLKAGYVMDKTFGRLHAVSVALRSDDERSCLLHLFDAAGEDFADDHTLRSHPISEADGIIFVVDPWAEESVARGALGEASESAGAANAATVQAQFIASRLVTVLEQQLANPGRRFHVPVAVVVTKVDVGGIDNRYRIGRTSLSREFSGFETAVSRALKEQAGVLRLLHDIGLGNLVQTLEARFDAVGYFAASPLGRSLDLSATGGANPFKPRGVLPPLIWLCWAMDALGDTDVVNVFLTNTHLYAIRCLRGLEGRGPQFNIRIAILAFIGILIVFPILLPGPLQVLYLLVTLPLLLLYITLAYILVYRPITSED